MSIELTDQSKALFRDFADDACNWSGTPLVDITPSQRGNLSDLKRKGLVTTFESDGDMWLDFTALGRDMAAQWFGIELD